MLRVNKNNWIIYTLVLFIVLAIMNDMINHFISNIFVSILLVFPLMVLLIVGGITLFILSVVHFFKRYKKSKVKSFLPIILSIALLFLVIERPLSPVFRSVEFSSKLEKRETVAKQILNGEITASNDRGDLFKVPKMYSKSSLSDGSEVLKIDDKLFFFTVRGILDNFSGYVYSPTGLQPTNEDVQAKIMKMQKMNHNWYYVSCT